MAALDAAKASGKFEYAFDPGMAWTGEWYPYAFSPFLQSFGGDIVDRSTYKTAEGALNGRGRAAFGEWWQGLFKNGYAQTTRTRLIATAALLLENMRSRGTATGRR